MRKTIITIPLLIIFLASCNFPLANNANSANVIATRVAQTLAAANPNAAETPAAGETVIYVTATESVLPTATTQITPTATPGDPKLALGAPNYADSLKKPSYWDLETPFSDNTTSMSIEGGNLVMTTKRAYSSYNWRLTYPSPKNFYVEATFKTVNCSGNDSYGLVLRAPDYYNGHGYYFGVNCSGEYNFEVDASGTAVTLVDWTADAHLLTGSGQENRLGVMMKDNHISLYINDAPVKQLDDDKINAAGYFGVFIRSYDQPSVTVNLDQINEWDLP